MYWIKLWHLLKGNRKLCGISAQPDQPSDHNRLRQAHSPSPLWAARHRVPQRADPPQPRPARQHNQRENRQPDLSVHEPALQQPHWQLLNIHILLAGLPAIRQVQASPGTSDQWSLSSHQTTIRWLSTKEPDTGHAQTIQEQVPYQRGPPQLPRLFA